MARYGYGISVSGTRALAQAVASAPLIPSDGLSLWLKGDAGLTTTPETYVSQIILDGAGTTTSDGTYTRASGGETQFDGPNGNYIYFIGGAEWELYDTQVYNPSTENYGAVSYHTEDFQSWFTSPLGEAPAPSGAVTNTPTATLLVTAWADQSGNGRNAQNSNEFPTQAIIGGKSFVSFGFFTDMLVPSTIWDNVQFVGTIFVVARFASSTSGATARLLFQEAVEGNFVFSRGYNNTNAFAITTDEVDFVSSSANADNNTNYILGATFSESNTATVYLNGISNGTGVVTNNTGVSNTLIGGGAESSNIAEMVVYNRVLTTPERQEVEAYLNAKYEIS